MSDDYSTLLESFYIEYGVSEIRDGVLVWDSIGTLRWARAGGVGPSSHNVGDIAGWISLHGYRVVKIRIGGRKRTILCHRIVKFISEGFAVDSNSSIDHINGDRMNNDPSNLRIATPTENARNKTTARLDSSSKLMGVSRIRGRMGRARFQPNTSGIKRHIGVYPTAYSACNAYWDAKMKIEPVMAPRWSEVRLSQLALALSIDEGSNENLQ